MIKEIKNIREQASAQNFYVWVIKKKNWRIQKNRGPKTATRQNIGAASAAPAAPLPTPMHYDRGWPSVVRNMSVKQMHGIYYTALKPVHFFSQITM